MNEALLNDYLLKYGKQIPKDILDIPDLEDRLHAIEKYIQENLDVKLVSREELIKNYLENKKPEEVSEESFAKQRLEFIKRLLKFKTNSPILELPDSVDKLIALGLTENQAYDLMIEMFSKELGIERAILPKYYEAVQTINRYTKDKKLEIVLGKDVLEALKIRAVVLRATWTEKAEVFEPVATTFTNSEEVWRESISFDYKKFYTGGEMSVQEMFDNPLFSVVSDYGKDKLKTVAWNKFAGTKIGQTVIEKLGINAATKTAVAATTATTTTAATTAGAAAAGAAAVTAVTPIIGTLIGFVAGIILPKIQDGLSWTKRNFKKVAIGTAVTLGFVGGGVSWAVGSFVISYGVLNASKVLGTVGSGASFVLNLLQELVATEIVWPIVAIIIATPIVIALILFIITNSALVVPFSQSEYFGSLFENDGLTNKSSCPIIMTSSAAGSYNPITQKGHGSNEYWHALYSDESSMCKYSIPATSGCRAPTVGQDNVCYKKGLTQCDFYGFAMDVSSSSSNNVSLPQIDGKDVKWNFSGVEYEDSGVGWTYGYTDESGKYSILLKHVNRGMTKENNLMSGTKLGSLYNQGTSTHLHLEVQVDGRYVRPENYFCNK